MVIASSVLSAASRVLLEVCLVTHANKAKGLSSKHRRTREEAFGQIPIEQLRHMVMKEEIKRLGETVTQKIQYMVSCGFGIILELSR